MSENPYLAPESEITMPPTDGEAELATLGQRLAGALIDGLIMMAVNFPIMVLTGYWSKATTGEVGFGNTLIFTLLGMVVYFLLNGKLLASKGQTIGKKLMKTQIVSSETNTIIPLKKIFTHRVLPVTVVNSIPFIGGFFALADAFFVFRKDRRCIHDLIAGTRVIQYKE